MSDRPPAMSWVEELRRSIERRLRRRRLLALAILIGCAIAPLAASIAWKPPVLLVWNASASAPVGLYRLRVALPVRRGDMVIAWAPEPARQLAAGRRYLPANVPLVKHVAAAPGDRVCAEGNRISINGKPVAKRRRTDSAGRSMPWWSGCRRLGFQEYFLLMDGAMSFDGRYFGVTDGNHLLGRAELLWAKAAQAVD